MREVLEPRPQRDVRRVRVLGLEPGQATRSRQGRCRSGAAEEPLAGERRPVELAEGELGRRHQTGGSQSGGASSKPSKSNAGATMQPTSVQAPSGRAACQAPAGTTTCGSSPAMTSAPSRWTATAGSPSAQIAQLQRFAGRELPDLVGVDAMPVRSLAGREQVEDRAAGRAGSIDRRRPPRLGEPASLGMGAQSQGGDHGRGIGHVPEGIAARRPASGRVVVPYGHVPKHQDPPSCRDRSHDR